MTNSPVDNVQQSWVCSPYSLISWWDMEQFSAERFYLAGSYLGRARRGLEGHDRQISLQGTEFGSAAEGLFTKLRSQFHLLGLNISVQCLDEFMDNFKEGMSVGQTVDFYKELENTIRREMAAVNFFFLPSKQAAFYDQRELFGVKVNAKFPSVQYDMVEAGNCFAMGRGTASVFHLMRIMEIGVQQLGVKLGVMLVGEKNWQNILDGINKSIKVLPAKDSTTVAMSQASANLYAVKLAWRNEVMHPKDTYTLEEAENLIRQVRIFMEQLETIV